jgi:hypothetical protein
VGAALGRVLEHAGDRQLSRVRECSAAAVGKDGDRKSVEKGVRGEGLDSRDEEEAVLSGRRGVDAGERVADAAAG